jgi:hypothetical protein
MILPFSTILKGKQTYFVEKILKGLRKPGRNALELFIADALNTDFGGKYEINRAMLAICKPKIHTIREDNKSRWYDARLIHAVINNRQKGKMLTFAPPFKCWYVQNISIKWENTIHAQIPFESCTITIDGIKLNFRESQQLAVNDGFENLNEFSAYFNTNFTGKLIHFTDFKY